ncbi:MAG: hypothetical protein JSW07_01275 [bacterium]|nr:MAG: hypothetical protein JSW07_01275 [bacterium]
MSKKLFILFYYFILLGMSLVPQASAQKEMNWEDVAAVMFEYNPGITWSTHNIGRPCGYPAWDVFWWPHYTTDIRAEHAIRGSFIFAVEDNVIESYYNEERPDWLPKLGSLGYYHGRNQQLYGLMINNVYPRLATSDMPLTWPQRSRSDPSIEDRNGDRYWPGRMKAGSKETDRWNKSAPFASSDREVFCVFDDHANVGEVLGIEVQEQIYTYGRPYAKDMCFLDFLVINTSNKDIKDAYIGYHLFPFIPGGGAFDDYLAAYDSENDKDDKPDVIYCYDPEDDGSYPDPDFKWGEDIFGLVVLETPLTVYSEDGEIEDMGVTDFHFFYAIGPENNKTQWPVISSNPTDPDLAGNIEDFFHNTGPDNRIDNTDWIPENEPDGAEWAFVVMSGPVDLAAGDSTRYTIAFAAGWGEEEFKEHVRQAQLLHKADYLGPGPPPPPNLTAVPEDGKITLYWDDLSEHATDPFSGDYDFEGYKLYRLAKGPFGEDIWGKKITNNEGTPIGYVPLFQCDKIDGIMGNDSLNIYNYLGSETGLQHSFVDTTVVNGVNYTYCITAYDHGGLTLRSGLPSYESSRSDLATERFVAGAVAGPKALGLVSGSVSNDILFVDPNDPSCFITIDVINPDAITGHDYEISFTLFTELQGNMVYRQGFNLYDKTLGQYVLKNAVMTDSSAGGDNTPPIDGLRLNFVGRPPIGDEAIWIEPFAARDGAELPYWDGKRYNKENDFLFTVDTDNPTTLTAFSGYGDATYEVPIRVTNLNTGEDITHLMQIADQAAKHPGDSYYNAVDYPTGSWDLSPGGACWNPIVDSLFLAQGYEKAINSVDQIIAKDPSLGFLFRLYTIHPPDGTSPSNGDIFYLGAPQQFPPNAIISFSTTKSYTDETKITNKALDKIRVVPNPYIVKAAWDIYNRMGKVIFTHLPEICDIRIYTVAGDLVKTIKHRGAHGYTKTPGSIQAQEYTTAGQGYEEWDLTTNSQLAIAYGLYIYVVETTNNMKKIGKLAIIK